MVVLVFFIVERNTNNAICIFDFAIMCICLMFIDLYKNKKFVRKVKKKGTISSVIVSCNRAFYCEMSFDY